MLELGENIESRDKKEGSVNHVFNKK